MIASFDPGGTTGIAYRHEGDLHTLITLNPEELYDWFTEHNKKMRQVIIENFVTSGTISTDGLYTVRLVGGLLALCHIHRIPVDLRNSITRVAFLPVAKETMKKLKPNHVIHEVDAMAHLLQWEFLAAHGKTNPRQKILEKFNQ